METKEIFAQKLIELREASNVTQQTLADELGITRQSLSLYEQGGRTANIDILKKAATYFHVSADYFLGISNAYTTETELKAVCDYVGFSEVAIQSLKSMYELTKYIDNPIQKSFYIDDDFSLPQVTREFYLEFLENFITYASDIVDLIIKEYLADFSSNELKKEIKQYDDKIDEILKKEKCSDLTEEKLDMYLQLRKKCYKEKEKYDFKKFCCKSDLESIFEEITGILEYDSKCIKSHNEYLKRMEKKAGTDNGEHNPSEE